ncbi:thymidylate synthase [Luteimonas sp. A482]
MNAPLIVSSSNELQAKLCRHIGEWGKEVSPRGLGTSEVLGLGFELTDPRNRLTTLSARRWSPALAVAELAWHLRGDSQVDALAFYTPKWREFADDHGVVRGSCYGARIFGACPDGSSQWLNVIGLLSADPCSRRAVLNFRIQEDVSRQSVDVSCTNTLQFLLRDGKLHAFVNMRSNDAIWGVPYDLFLFTCLQELMAVELGVELGHYYHYAASMHIYERHRDVASRIAVEGYSGNKGKMPAMSSAASVYAMARAEASLRMTGVCAPMSDRFSECCIDLLRRHKKVSLAA